jgi:aspartyl aminopeptidase
MHSCREVMGLTDLEYGVKLFTGFFSKFRELDDAVE